MKFTLGTLLSGRVASMLNTCDTDSRLVTFANTAQEMLLHRGRWYGTVVRAKFCVTSGCLVWPREVATIERVSLCGKPIGSHNLWYEFTEFINPYCGDCCYRTDPRLIDTGNAPTISDIDAGKKVVAIATHADDVGKSIVVQGNDENNNWVRTDDGGTVIDGESITLALSPGTVSTTVFNTITGIRKDVTDYDVLLYQYDPDTNAIEKLLGRYQPSEIAPDYRRSTLRNIDNGCCCNSDSDNPTYTVEAIVSLQHVPVSGDGDWFILQNQRAIELTMHSLKLEEDEKDKDAEVKLQKAIRELQHHNEKYWPSTNARIITSGHGTAHPSKLFTGFI